MTTPSDRERAVKVCELTSHKWNDEYYGVRCEQCGTFYPYGCEPWLPFDGEDDDCAYSKSDSTLDELEWDEVYPEFEEDEE